MAISRSLSNKTVKVKDPLVFASRKLLSWYDKNRRVLPWRALPHETIDPYIVLVSEIMLQQTTVAAVGPYFQRFMKKFPNLKLLATAHRDDVLKLWAGLGYYRRAHLLHECAQRVWFDHKGKWPIHEHQLMELPGLGRYTAAAIAAIGFNQRANVVDGNVERVIARLFAIRHVRPALLKAVYKKADQILPNNRYGDYAQALMDLGSLICTPKSPRCTLCPWSKLCLAHQMGLEDKLPKRLVRPSKPLRRGIAFVVLNDKNELLLRKRPSKGLLGGMLEVPTSPWKEGPFPSLSKVRSDAPFQGAWVLLPQKVKHSFSHFDLELQIAHVRIKKNFPGLWVPLDRWQDEALPGVMRKIVLQVVREL